MNASQSVLAAAFSFLLLDASLMAHPEDAEILAKAVKSVASGKAQEAPAIDGALDDACWSKAAFASGFSDFKTRAPADRDTEFAICHDAENLYLAVRCKTDEGYTVKSSGNIWGGDLVEIFLDPGASGYDYFHIASNPEGKIFKERGYGRSDALWAPQVRAAGRQGKSEWTLEMAIPLADFRFQEPVGPTWLLNIVRSDNANGTKRCYTWAPVFGDLHQISDFQPATGIDIDSSRFLWAASLKGDGLIADKAPVELEIQNRSGRSQEIQLTMKVQRVGAAYPATCSMGTFTLDSGSSTAIAAPALFNECGRYLISLEGRDAMNRLLFRSRNFEVEKPKEAFRASCNQRVYYRNETVSKVEARLFAKRSGGERINFALSPLKGGAAPVRKESEVDANGRATASFDIGGLLPGDYLVVASWKGHGDAKAPFSVIAREIEGPSISIDAKGVMRMDGRPFLPRGLFTPGPWYKKSAECPMDETDWNDMKAKGFNAIKYAPFWRKTFTAGGPKITDEERRNFWSLLARLHKAGLKVAMTINHFCRQGSDVPDIEGLKAYVSEFRGHPAVLCWYIADEPDLGGVSPESLEKVCQEVKALDPRHPVSVLVMGAFVSYRDAADILLSDKYPITEASSTPGTAVYCLSRAGVRALKPRQAFWMTPQFFCNYPQEEWKRCPAPEEATLMSFQALCAGAKGLFHFGYSPADQRSEKGTPTPYPLERKRLSWELWEGSARMNEMLIAAEPFILEGAPAPEIVVEKDDSSSIQSLSLRLGGKTLAILCNSSQAPAKANVKGLAAMKSAMRMDYEGERTLELKDGSVSVDLKPCSATLLFCE